MSIPGCQLDCNWNELQSGIGGHTCDPDLVAGIHKLLTQILTRDDTCLWFSTWGIGTMKSVGPCNVVQAFNPRRLRKADLWVHGQAGTEQVPNPYLLLEAYIRALEDIRLTLHCLLALACRHIYWISGFQVIQKTNRKHPASWGWANSWPLDFLFTADHCWVSRIVDWLYTITINPLR